MRRVVRGALTAVALGLGVAPATLGCGGALRTVLAPTDELEVYRAFRVSAAPGTRLAHAQRYLARHPNGTFAAEVRAAFEEEEPRFFEACQRTRAGVLRYLVDLPEGPHARAAQASLLTFDADMQEAELRDVAQRARADEARLETAAVQRRAVGQAIVGAVGALLEDGVYGVPRDELPPVVRGLLLGRARATWGALPAQHEEDLFFVLPTRPVRESRLLTLEIALREDEGEVTSARIQGEEMFVRWAEADRIVPLDPADAAHRREAFAHAEERLSGAFERRFPSGTCKAPGGASGTSGGTSAQPTAIVLDHRACDGWEVLVTAAAAPGGKDVILIHGPRARKATAR